MLKRTPLYETHVKLGARMVDFAGWQMPVAYGSQIEEHHAVRRHAGVFDVSHMTLIDAQGAGAQVFLRYLLANDVRKLDAAGKALYSCMLREDGGVIDDLIVYRLGDENFRLVVNAATHDKDLAWMAEHSVRFDLTLRERDDLALLAVQGPKARELAARSLSDGARCLELEPFSSASVGRFRVARTGYTGEDGFEIMLPGEDAARFWDSLMSKGVIACGLGARDTLRLEAGMNLYGADMDERISPLECGLAWTVALGDERSFIGREAIERRRREGASVEQAGLILEDKGVLRAGYPVSTGRGEGIITSGSYAPTLRRSIALARVPVHSEGRCSVSIRGRAHRARIVKPPFVRKGRIKVQL